MTTSRARRWMGMLTLVALATLAPAAHVLVEHGCVVLMLDGGERRMLTSLERDAEPVLAPDGQLVAFVRNTPGRMIATGAGDFPATELWTMAVDGSEARCRLTGRADPDMARVLAGISTLQFSADGTVLYFLSQAWTTSAAVHRLELRTGTVRFIAGANSLEVVARGPDAGRLIVSQHRYRPGGGSDDDYWLITAEGVTLRRLGGEGEVAAFKAAQR